MNYIDELILSGYDLADLYGLLGKAAIEEYLNKKSKEEKEDKKKKSS